MLMRCSAREDGGPPVATEPVDAPHRRVARGPGSRATLVDTTRHDTTRHDPAKTEAAWPLNRVAGVSGHAKPLKPANKAPLSAVAVVPVAKGVLGGIRPDSVKPSA